jgi:hypothetical protein
MPTTADAGTTALQHVHRARRADRRPARLPRSAGGPAPHRHPVVRAASSRYYLDAQISPPHGLLPPRRGRCLPRNATGQQAASTRLEITTRSRAGRPRISASRCSTRRPAAPLTDSCWLGLRTSDCDRMLEVLVPCLNPAKAPVGNLFGNPGVTTRRYRTGLDGIGPAREQPGRSWAGPVGRLRSDS